MNYLKLLYSLFVLCLLSFVLVKFPGQALAQENQSCAVNIDELRTEYGFSQSEGSALWDKRIQDNKESFNKVSSYAINYSKSAGLEDPILVVWWAMTETVPPYDSYSWSNCLDKDHNVNTNCPGTESGQWQLGYGQQFARYPFLPKAFDTIYGVGSSSDAQKAKQSIEEVLTNAKQDLNTIKATYNYEGKSVKSIIDNYQQNGDGQSKYLISILQRDPKVSAYLVAGALQGDMSGGNKNWQQITARWHPYYVTAWTTVYDNAFNSIAKAWNQSCGGFKSTTNLPAGGSGTKTIGGSEEAAVHNISITQPEQVRTFTQSEKSYYEKLVSLFNNIWGQFFSTPINRDEYYAKADGLNKGEVPKEIQPADKNLKGYICEESGIYSNSLPKFSKKIETVQECEEIYDNSVFPENINVVVPL